MVIRRAGALQLEMLERQKGVQGTRPSHWHWPCPWAGGGTQFHQTVGSVQLTPASPLWSLMELLPATQGWESPPYVPTSLKDTANAITEWRTEWVPKCQLHEMGLMTLLPEAADTALKSCWCWTVAHTLPGPAPLPAGLPSSLSSLGESQV